MKKLDIFLDIVYALLLVYLIGNSLWAAWNGETASNWLVAGYLAVMMFWWLAYLVMRNAMKVRNEVIKELQDKLYRLTHPVGVSER